MKKIILPLVFLAACTQETPDFMQSAGANAKKECPIISSGQTVSVAKITFDQQSLELASKDKEILGEVADMYQRCGGKIIISGSNSSAEASDYGLLRAGVVFKELEKNRVRPNVMDFKQKNNATRDVLVSFKK